MPPALPAFQVMFLLAQKTDMPWVVALGRADQEKSLSPSGMRSAVNVSQHMDPTWGIVAMLDALGTKGILARTDASSAVETWSNRLRALDQIVKRTSPVDIEVLADDGQAETRTFNLYEKIELQTVSDTVILTIPFPRDPTLSREYDPLRLVGEIPKLLSRWFFDSLLVGLYFRGAFSLGEFYRTHSLIMGPAVDEVSEWHARSDWFGVHAAPSASFALDALAGSETDAQHALGGFERCDIPMRGDSTVSGWAVAWPRILVQAEPNAPGVIQKVRAKMLRRFSDSPIGPAAFRKYENTVAFFDKVTGPEDPMRADGDD